MSRKRPRPLRQDRDGDKMRDEKAGLKALIESLIFAAGGIVTLNALCRVIPDEERESVRDTLNELVEDYAAREGGFFINKVAGGYEFRSRQEFAPWIKTLLGASPRRLSRAALETLAMVAYRQPVTRGEVEAIRGVDSGGVLSTLMERRLVKIAGRKNTPGRPVVYTTTKEFLEVFDLKDLSSLPSLKEIEAPEETEGLGQAEVEEEACEASAGEDVMTPEGDNTEFSKECKEDGAEEEEGEGSAREGSEDYSRGGLNIEAEGRGTDSGGQGLDKREESGDGGEG